MKRKYILLFSGNMQYPVTQWLLHGMVVIGMIKHKMITTGKDRYDAFCKLDDVLRDHDIDDIVSDRRGLKDRRNEMTDRRNTPFKLMEEAPDGDT